MPGLGETFRTARESQGRTLSDVADAIHIRSIYLAAIEAEDWQAIGPAVYVRGFLRSYARYLGLDADMAVAEFAGKATGNNAATSVILAPSPRGEPSRSGLSRGDAPKRGLSAWAVFGLVVAVALVIFVGYQYFEYTRGNRVSSADSVPAAASQAARGTGASHESTLSASPAVKPEKRLATKNVSRSNVVVVRLRESSWLRVVIDGKVAMEGVFATGTARSFAGRAATIRVGNAGGVNVWVDGKDLGPMGGPGDVAERSFQL